LLQCTIALALSAQGARRVIRKFGVIGKRRHMPVEWFARVASSVAADDPSPALLSSCRPLPALIFLCAAHRFLFASF
jgi:hypothetical protein